MILKRIFISIIIILGMDFTAGFILIPDSYQSFRTSHYYYHHGLLPNQATLGAWGALVYPVHTNSLGFMDSLNYKVDIESKNQRLLILGDSHSEGVGVPYLRTFSGRLAVDLKEENIDVLNASCISYSPKIEYLKVKYLIEKEGLIPDYIFLLIDISDLQNELVYENFNPEENFSSLKALRQKAGTFLNRHSAIYYMTNSIIQASRHNKFMETAAMFDENRKDNVTLNTAELYSDFFSHFDDNTLLSNPRFHGVGEWYYDKDFRKLADRGIDLGQEQILKLKALCEDYGIDLTISVHPWHPQIFMGKINDYYVNRWEEFASDNNISFLNLFPLFINEQNPVIVRDLYYIKGDNHWNEFGHEIVADSLQIYFENRKSKYP
jgi:hypothetical protein